MTTLTTLLRNTPIFPLLGEEHFLSDPYVFDFTTSGSFAEKLNPSDFDEFQQEIYNKLKEEGAEWGIGRYLEERKGLLRDYPQMIGEGRYYHLALDIVVPGGTPLFAPLEGTVYFAGTEEGKGNYGGLVILEHEVGGERFWSLYGHLNSQHLVQSGDHVTAGQQFAVIGSTARDTGGWFEHTHLQLLTERAYQEGRMRQGYLAEKDLPIVEELFPNPGLLFDRKWA